MSFSSSVVVNSDSVILMVAMYQRYRVSADPLQSAPVLPAFRRHFRAAGSRTQILIHSFAGSRPPAVSTMHMLKGNLESIQGGSHRPNRQAARGHRCPVGFFSKSRSPAGSTGFMDNRKDASGPSHPVGAAPDANKDMTRCTLLLITTGGSGRKALSEGMLLAERYVDALPMDLAIVESTPFAVAPAVRIQERVSVPVPLEDTTSAATSVGPLQAIWNGRRWLTPGSCPPRPHGGQRCHRMAMGALQRSLGCARGIDHVALGHLCGADERTARRLRPGRPGETSAGVDVGRAQGVFPAVHPCGGPRGIDLQEARKSPCPNPGIWTRASFIRWQILDSNQ